MNFIQSLFKSFERDIKKIIDGTYKPKKQNWCIGSGSSFEIYKKMTYTEALEIFNKLEIRQCFGKKLSETNKLNFIIQEYAAMESTIGSTFVFMFPVKLKLKYEKR